MGLGRVVIGICVSGELGSEVVSGGLDFFRGQTIWIIGGRGGVVEHLTMEPFRGSPFRVFLGLFGGGGHYTRLLQEMGFD